MSRGFDEPAHDAGLFEGTEPFRRIHVHAARTLASSIQSYNPCCGAGGRSRLGDGFTSRPFRPLARLSDHCDRLAVAGVLSTLPQVHRC